MKILIDARFYGLENAGIGRYVMNLLEEIKKQDHKNQYVVILNYNYFNKLNFPENWTKVLAKSRHYTLREQIEIKDLISSHSPDLVHFPHFNVPILYKGKFIVTIHDLLWHNQKGKSVTTLNPLIYSLKYIGYKIAFSKAVNSSQKIITPSNTVKNQINAHYDIDKNKIETIYEGVTLPKNPTSLQKLQTSMNLKTNYFVYTGSAYPHKNLKSLIQAFSLVNKSGYRTHLYIVSSRNIFQQKLKKFTNKILASNFVPFLGYVQDEDLFGLYQYCTGFITASLSEGFGLPALEAMAMGAPVAASAIPVFKEIYKDNVTYFNPKNVKSISTAITKILLLNLEERKIISNRSLHFASKFKWKKTATETIKVYHQFDAKHE